MCTLLKNIDKSKFHQLNQVLSYFILLSYVSNRFKNSSPSIYALKFM